jgi:hypothetical protein
VGALSDALAGAKADPGGRVHLLKGLLARLDPEDAADIVSALKAEHTPLMLLLEKVNELHGFGTSYSSWQNYRREARAGKYDRWVT